MNSIVSSITDIDPTQWQELIAQSPTASFFQTPECYDFYASLSFLKPFIYGISENDKLMGVVCGYIIADGNALKRFFSRRAIVPGGVLLDNQISPLALQEFLKFTTHELSQKSIYIEIRNYKDYAAFRPTFVSTGFKYLPHLNFHVATPDFETALRVMSESKRRHLKTSQKAGVECLETTSKADINAFYKILKYLYRTKVKTPLFPLEFFEKLVCLPNGKLLVVKHQGVVIGGMACVVLPGNTLYEWFVCGDGNAEKETYPSVAATWAGIEYASKNNIPRFDFMGAGKPNKSYGVREFKRKFGGQLVEHGRFLHVCNPILYLIGRFVVEVILQKKTL